MKNRFIVLFALVIAFSILSQAVSADTISPGMRMLNWCYEIANINDYPDYVFVYNDERVTGHGIVGQGDCFQFYKLGLTTIYAINKSEFNDSELNREFFEGNNPKLIKSDLQLEGFGAVQESDPLKEMVITLNIVSLNHDYLDIQKSKLTYIYSDGAKEEKYFPNQTQKVIRYDTVPERSRTPSSSFWFAKFWYVALPIVAIVIIGIVLLRRLKR
jgi:hypothetical protein